MTLSDILNRLEGVKGCDGKYMARCPNHGDKTPSLSISLGDDGRTLLKCFAGCATEDVVWAMGLTMKDLFIEPVLSAAFPVYDAPSDPNKPTKEAEYLYAGGQLKKVKYRKPDGSKFCAWLHKEGNGWAKGRDTISSGLYHVHVLDNVESLFLVEGEKDVENMDKAGMVAVSLPDGAQSKWDATYGNTLANKRIAILPDNDAPGMKYAQMCAEKLHGVATKVWILDLKQAWPEIPEKGDVSDLIERFGVDEAMRMVCELLRNTPQWEPPTDAPEQNNTESTVVKPLLICAADVPYEPPRWLISPYFQRGKGTLVQADNGTGKTAFMCAIAAMVSTGNPLINIPVNTPGDVLILSVEDDLPVLRGRIEANGGNLGKCHFMSNAAGMTFTSPEVEQAVKLVNAKLVIFDPFQAFLGSDVDMFRANQTRPALAKLFEMCDRNDCACVIISHMGKNGFNKSPVNQALGSVDIPAAMRSILQITKNPEDENERIAVHIKCSNAPIGRSIVYSIGERGGVEWRGFSDFSAEDLATVIKRKEKGIPYDQEPLVQVFNQLIANRPGGGFWSYADLKAEGAKILGFPPFADITDLRQKLNGPLSKELQAKDGLIVTSGVKGAKGVRGVRIEQYVVPESYQASIPGGAS